MALLPTAGYLTRIEVRRHRRALAVLAAMTALVTAVVLASLAGASRSASAFDRYLDEVRAPHAAALGEPDAMARLDDLDAVEDTIDFDLVAAFPVASSQEDFYPLVASEGGKLLYEHFRLPVVEGRLPDREEPYEVAVGERTARRLQVGVGDAIDLLTATPEGAQQDEGGVPDGPPLTLDVVGIVRDPGDIGARAQDITLTFLTPAFREAHGRDEIGTVGEGTMIVLAPGHQLREVTEAIGPSIEVDPTFSAESFREQLDPTMRSLATALQVFAGVAGLAGLVAIALAGARLQQAAAVDDGTLAALGTAGVARWARLAAPTVLATTAGALVGAAASVAASPLFPIGLARRAEPDPGFSFDAAVAIGGALAAVALFLVVTAATARTQQRRAGRHATSLRPNPWGRAAAAAGAPLEAVTGFTLAGGRTSGQSSIATGGALLGVLGVLAVLVFGASIQRLRDDPELYGWPWDAVIEGADLSDLGGDPDVADLVAEDDRVVAAGRYFSQAAVTIDGLPEYASVIESAKGVLASPVVVDGQAPVAADEVALGRDTMDRLGVQIGDEVTVEMTTGRAQLRITGVSALPVSGDGGSLATGVVLSAGAIEPLGVDRVCAQEETSCTRKIVVELAEGADPARFASDVEAADASVDVTLPTPPPDIDRLTAVEDLPGFLAVFLAVLAATAIGFATATAVRQRRRDLAVLRVLGMTARRVGAVVAILVAALTTVGSLLGVVLGVAVGRQVWRWIAEAVSVQFAPELPLAGVVLVPLGAILLAQVVASGGRRSAARIPTAIVLRAE